MDNVEAPSEPAVITAAEPVDLSAPSTDAAEAAPSSGNGALGAADGALGAADGPAPPPAAAAPAEDGKAGAAGEVSYSSPSMAAARALFAAPKAAPAPVPSPRREGPSAAALKFGGGGAKAKADDAAAAAAASAAAAEPAGPPVTVYHKGAYYPVAELVAATRQSPGAFAGIDFNEKELMLNEEGFKAVFGMSHAEFLQLGKWKRDQKKKEKGMF